MKILNCILATFFVTGSLISCRPAAINRAEVKEFEFSSDICDSIQKATDTRWTSASGISKVRFHAHLIATETQIIAYELPRYRQRAADLNTPTAPANGPSGAVTPLATVKPKPVADNPKDAVISAKPTQSAITSNFALDTTYDGNSVSLAKEVCPGCSKETVQSKLSTLESNKAAIGSCQFKDSTPAAAVANANDPDAGLTQTEKAQRAEQVAVPSKEVPGTFEKNVCWCDYSCYQDDWGSDTELSRSNFYTVISGGDAGGRECRNQDSRWNWTGANSSEGYKVYWKKHGCEVVKARSKDQEGFASSGGFEVYYGGKWIYKNMSATSGSCP